MALPASKTFTDSPVSRYKVKFHVMAIKTPDKLNWAPTHLSNQRSTQPHLLLTRCARNIFCLPWPPFSAHTGPIDGGYKPSPRAIQPWF